MRHLSLFTGIGGFELAATRVWGDDYEPVLFCEMDKFCQKVLKKHWPDVPIVEDVRDVTTNTKSWKEYQRECRELEEAEEGGKGLNSAPGTSGSETGLVQLLTGGFPCQPFSQAGKRDGRSDDRFLWPEMLRVIQAFQPTWVVAENVRGILSIEDGMVFEQVCTDLEDAGYEVQPLVIPAVGVDANHRRDRVWFVAYSKLCSDRANGGQKGETESLQGKRGATGYSGASSGTGVDSDITPDRNDTGLQGGKEIRDIEESRTDGNEQSGRCDRRGRLTWLTEPDVGRVANGVSDRMDRLKALGNAIVPQVAEQIFRAIKATEQSQGVPTKQLEGKL